MKKILKVLISASIVICSLYILQLLVMPKYMNDIIEGAFIQEYYNEVHDHDVLFIGDCELYSNFVPTVLWQEYGINSYIRGSAQQLIWQSYYLLEESLNYEIPDVVVFNVLSMQYGTPQQETYNRMTLDGMKWSSSKLSSIQASMLEDESLIDYIFPLFRYHSRWSDLSVEDFEYLFTRDTVTFNGYYMRNDIKEVGYVPEGNILANYQFDDICYEYLDMITELCKENGIELLLVKAPSLYPYWYPEWEQQMVDYASDNDLFYVNYLDLIDDLEVDFAVDTYDGGLHLNLNGATKITNHLGSILFDYYGLDDRSNDSDLSDRWDVKIELFNENIEKQLNEIDE